MPRSSVEPAESAGADSSGLAAAADPALALSRNGPQSALGGIPILSNRWSSWLWYECAYAITMAAYSFGFSFRWEGGRNLPRSGPALLIANHQSFLDPVAIGLAVRRHICFLARKTLFANPWFGAFLRSVNVVPVDQEGVAKDGLRTVLDLLRAGQAVLVFPEGERTLTGDMKPLKPGIHLLIRKSPDVPIIPVGIAGAFEAYPRTRVVPRLSPLFWPPTGAGVAVSVGRPLDAAHFRNAGREQVLEELFAAIHDRYVRAEQLRRK
jgi:1-acyl-sn-glycerol-3-phosphate acyltransferase